MADAHKQMIYCGARELSEVTREKTGRTTMMMMTRRRRRKLGGGGGGGNFSLE